jgi:hypothetical protein
MLLANDGVEGGRPVFAGRYHEIFHAAIYGFNRVSQAGGRSCGKDFFVPDKSVSGSGT